MKKLGLLILLIASVSSLNLKALPVDELYAAFVSLFKGFAKTPQAACAGVIEKEKNKILEIIYMAVDDLNAGKNLNTAVQTAVIRLVGIDELVDECNVLAMPPIIANIGTKDGIIDILQNLIDYIDNVVSYGKKIKSALDIKDYNGAAEALGHILSIGFDFTVN